MKIFDEETKTKILPEVICEPSLGVERAFLVFMLDSYFYDKERDSKFRDYQTMIIASQIHRIGKRFGVSGETIYNLIENIGPEFKGFIHPAVFSRQVAEQLQNEELKEHVLGKNQYD